MKLLPNVALALMLSLGATAMVAAPATAQKNKKDDKAAAGVPKLSASPAFGKAAQEVKKALDAKDYATAEAKLAIADPLATTDDDKYFANIFRLNIASEKKDNATLATALDALIVNPKTPAADLPAYNFVRGTIAIEAKQNEQAIPFLLKARELGYTKTDLSVSLAQAYGSTNRTKDAIAELNKAVETETAAGRVAPESWYAYAVSNSYAARDVPTAEEWLVRQLKVYPKVATWRTAVNNFRKVTDPTNTKFTKAQKLDLYRTMRGTKVLSDPNDYYGYVQAALDSGLPRDRPR